MISWALGLDVGVFYMVSIGQQVKQNLLYIHVLTSGKGIKTSPFMYSNPTSYGNYICYTICMINRIDFAEWYHDKLFFSTMTAMFLSGVCMLDFTYKTWLNVEVVESGKWKSAYTGAFAAITWGGDTTSLWGCTGTTSSLFMNYVKGTQIVINTSLGKAY